MPITVNSSLQLEVSAETNTQKAHAAMAAIDAAATKNPSIWIREMAFEQPMLFEEALATTLLAVKKIVETPDWPIGISISIWVRVSSPKEFTGLVVSADICAQAAKLNVDLVFSVYGCQSESTL